MSDVSLKNFLVLIGAALTVFFLLFMRPDYFADYSTLSTVLGAELLFLTVLKFRQLFFPVLILVFLLASTDLPAHAAFLSGRWLVLAAGAVCGVPVYMRNRTQSFSQFHLIASFCIVSAMVSAFVSEYPQEAVLKAVSLTLLFIYAACGGRIAVSVSQPALFFRRLVVACEILNVFIAICYFGFRREFLGSPNSLGATMGVALVPVLLWGVISAERPMQRRRLSAGLIVAMLLLMSSFARASIAAAMISSVLLCVSLRQYRLLIKGLALAILLAVAAVMFVPEPTEETGLNSSGPVSAIFLYKGHAEGGVLASRRGVWTQTWDVIQQNPWFGSGFGTSSITDDMTRVAFAQRHVDSWIIREHGNSYLAIMEWVGLLGVIPFYALLLLAARNAHMVFAWARRVGDTSSPALPAATIIVAGLVNALFEDWMFAVGYFVCVFFWTIAFILVDLVPQAEMVPQAYAAASGEPHFQGAPAVSLT